MQRDLSKILQDAQAAAEPGNAGLQLTLHVNLSWQLCIKTNGVSLLNLVHMSSLHTHKDSCSLRKMPAHQMATNGHALHRSEAPLQFSDQASYHASQTSS